MKMKSIDRNKKIWISSALGFVLFFLASCPRRTVAQTNTFPNDGNVGIGTTSPNSKLHVVGNLLVDGIITSNSEPAYGAGSQLRSWGINKPDSNMYIEWGDTAASTLYITDHWRYTSPVAIMAGNVGIGTLAPYYKLDIQGGASRNTLAITGDGDGVGYAGITINALTTTNISEYRTSQFKLHMRKDSWYGGDGSGPSFIIESTSKIGGFAAPFMITPTNDVILSSGRGVYGMPVGNVGIGTTTPDQRLTLALGSTIKIQDPSEASWGTILSNNSSGDGYLETAGHNLSISAGWDKTLRLGDPNFSTYGGKVVIPGGNVGIGTTSPGYKLDVNGEINATGLRINGTPISTGGSQWNNGPNSISYSAGNVGIGTTNPGAKLDVQGAIASNRNWFYLAGAGDTNHAISNVSGDGEQFRYWNFLDFYSPNGGGNVRLLNNGNVGIGTGTPAAKLDVNGSIRGGGYSAGAGNISSYSMEVGGPNPSATNGVATIFFHHHGVVANQLRYTNGTLYWEAAGNGYGTTQPNLVVSGTINAKYQDVAEWVPSTEKLSAGTVVVLDSSKSNQVIASSQSYDTRVAGVISEQPGIALGEKSDNKVLVATTGRVRVKVDATKSPIHIGDLLVTSDIPGVAMRSEAVNIGDVQLHRPGTLIGKALEPLEKGSGEILVLLSLQ